jgi:ribose 5-phosphate isomerase B
MKENILLASDHAGFAMKSFLIETLKKMDASYEDLGCPDESSCDYPVFAKKLCQKVLGTEGAKGILICGTGIGMSMTANRFPGIRAALCVNEYHARMSRAHNDSNVLILGGRVLGTDLALSIVQAWLETPFEGGRHQRRIDLIDQG